MKINLLYGSTTGDTENVAQHILPLLEAKGAEVRVCDVAFDPLPPSEDAVLILMGASTWYYGEIQSDWISILPILPNYCKDWSQKSVALFGCGDQEDYADYFCDALGILYEKLAPFQPRWIGQTSASGYYFKKSRASISGNKLMGLALDEHRQPELTQKRSAQWVQQLWDEMSNHDGPEN